FPIRIDKRGVSLIARDGPDVTSIINDSPSDPRTVIIHLEGGPTPLAATGIQGFTIDGGGLALNRFAVAIESLSEVPGTSEPEPFIRDCRIKDYGDVGIQLITFGATPSRPPGNSLRAIVERNQVSLCGIGIAAATRALDGVTTAHDESILRNN